MESAAASAYAQEIGAMYLETSAKDDINVHDIFVQLSKFLSFINAFCIDIICDINIAIIIVDIIYQI